MPRWAYLLLTCIVADTAAGQWSAPTMFGPGVVAPPATGQAFSTNPSGGYGFNPFPSNPTYSAPSTAPAMNFGAAPAVRPTPVWNDPSTWGLNLPQLSNPFPGNRATAASAPTFSPNSQFTNSAPAWNNPATNSTISSWFNSNPSANTPNNVGANPFGANTWGNPASGAANSNWPVNTANNPLAATSDRIRQWLNPTRQTAPAVGPTTTWLQQPPPQYANVPQPNSFNPFNRGAAPIAGPNMFNTPAGPQIAQPSPWQTNPPQPTSFRAANPVASNEPPIVIPPAALAGEIYSPSRRLREQTPQPSFTQPQRPAQPPPTVTPQPTFNAPPQTYPQQPPPNQQAVRPQRNWLEMTDLPAARR